MKESSFYSEDFEQLIREKTEQYKMYPSERVWKGVHNSLHTKRRWFIGSMALLVTGILFFAGRELISPSSRLEGDINSLPAKKRIPVTSRAILPMNHLLFVCKELCTPFHTRSEGYILYCSVFSRISCSKSSL